jgi:hypothetical protein
MGWMLDLQDDRPAPNLPLLPPSARGFLLEHDGLAGTGHEVYRDLRVWRH